MAERPRIEFWYDFASTYSYLSVMRITALAQVHDIRIEWRPFLLGAIFARQGWSTSPFNLYPAKGRNMMRDLERLAQERGLGFRMPDPFPQNSLLAARVGTVGVEEGWIADFTRGVFQAEFATGAQISDPQVLAGVLEDIHLDAKRILAAAQSSETKDALRRRTDEAIAKDIYGAPSFVVGQELFWGDDRLEQALRWAES